MTYDKMKYVLGDYLRCKRICERHQRELKMIRDKMESAGVSMDYTKPRVKTAASGNAAYADMITEAMFLERQIQIETMEVISARKRTEKLIGRLRKQEQRDVLRYKYLHDWTWQDIGDVMGYSRERARHIRYEAVKELVAGYAKKKK